MNDSSGEQVSEDDDRRSRRLANLEEKRRLKGARVVWPSARWVPDRVVAVGMAKHSYGPGLEKQNGTCVREDTLKRIEAERAERKAKRAAPAVPTMAWLGRSRAEENRAKRERRRRRGAK